MNAFAAFERNPFFVYTPGEGGAVLYDPHHKRTIWMDAQGVRLWEFLAEPRGESDLSTFLGAHALETMRLARALELVVDARRFPSRSVRPPMGVAPVFEVLDGPPVRVE
ncbi:MAG: hypothetical protein ACOZNI_17745 [Myxococcota bacterium]